ncbi:MFS transporter [Haliea sp. E1-2-M8]|uniref:MFS transporter n=1 Tax=Haliea sp. E1-2-M8 TaxID=3064706 RepID=UPI0027157DA0|nr:MFS transporter [Haliea sp. E1-2-M8]MDO8861162.1 MFS transporter [Haliea sp. E1-2-M8]
MTSASRERELPDRIYTLLVEEEDVRVCRDIPESACHEQPRAFVLQLAAQTLTKIGDALTSSRLVLAWMLSALGSPAIFIALLVPVRESLSLMPQLFVAQFVREHAVRKMFWAWGSVAQGLALALMVPAVLLLREFALGLAVVILLALFSLARGVCSVAAKDVLGKTVSKSRRGRLTGLSASAAGAVTLAVAVLLLLVPELAGQGADGNASLFAAILALAALLWLAAAAVYAGVPEVPGATQGGANAILEALRSLSLLRTDRQFRNFVTARMLLISSAFAIPYIVVLIQRGAEGQLLSFAALLLAEGAAGLLSAPFWGRWSDTGAHKVMAAAAAISVAAMGVALGLYWLLPGAIGMVPVASLLLFVAAVAHQGARVGRKTYLVDMASSENRAQYTAVSNTVIGLFLFSGAGLGVIDVVYGTASVLLFLALIGVLAVWRSLSLPSASD